ncbi:MAG: hypothetical protein LBI42_06585 [Chitinispirillales bacterium]|jgi:hypothetical protein|nr:hypothetical protein [Chitinispirillales bacterium]
MIKKSVFISGSISIGELPKEAIAKLDSIIGKEINVLVGDAKGIDLQVQKYFHKKNYPNVTVYFAGKQIRNNVGSWKTKSIQTNIAVKNRLFYTEKDKAMVADTDYGLMIWDGKSKGTLNNIKAMQEAQKKFYVILEEMVVPSDRIDSVLDIIESNKEPQLSLF